MQIKKAFTLFELLIVIFILSLVYFLGFGTIDFKPHKKAVSILDLKSTIADRLNKQQAKLICIDKCQSCFIQYDIFQEPQETSFHIKLSPNLTSYTLTDNDRLEPIEYDRFKDKKICLMIDFYPNGSSTPIVIENDKDFFFLPSLLRESKQVKTLEEAQELWLKYSYHLQNTGDFY